MRAEISRGRQDCQKHPRRLIFSLFAVCVMPFACSESPSPEVSPEDHILEERAREYFDARFRAYPAQATMAGVHVNDAELGRFSASHVKSRVAELRDFRQRLLGIDLTKLSRPAFIDALLLTNAVKAEIFELEEVESWRRSPRFYSDIICSGVWSLFEPGNPTRLDALLSRLHQIPSLLESAIQNIESLPPILIEDGIANFRHCQQLLGELRAALDGSSGASDAVLRGQIEVTSLAAQDSIEEFIVHLGTNVARGEVESFRLGEDLLRVQLLYGEMEETPLDEIRWLTERRLGETKQRIREIAVTTNSELSLPALLTEVSSQRFGGDEVLPYTVELLQDLRQFALKRNIASVLTYAADPAVEAVPSLPRGALGKLHVPGPAESTGAAVLRLAMPLADAPKVGRLLLFGPYMLQLLSMREVYPGNYVRFLSRSESVNRLSELRRLLTSRANREGWAHYAEEMFLDEGYGSADPLLRLVQLHQALVGLCRLVTTILIHAEGLSLETAARIFMNEAFLDASAAQREVRVIAADPTRMSAALGKLQISKLRSDYVNSGAETKTLRDFHDAFLGCGEPPLRMVRLLLLGGDEGRTLPD